MQTTQTNVRFGLTLANFRRFESIIQAAVLSYPQPVEVDWSQSDLRFTTYIARLRDAMTGLRQNNHWNYSLNKTTLASLVVRPHPTNPSRILIGDREATKPALVNMNVGMTEAGTYFPVFGDKPNSILHDISEAPKLRLRTSADPEMLQRAVVAYAELASMKVEGLPRLHLIKDDPSRDESTLIHVKECCDGYDVAVQETEKEFIIL